MNCYSFFDCFLFILQYDGTRKISRLRLNDDIVFRNHDRQGAIMDNPIYNIKK